MQDAGPNSAPRDEQDHRRGRQAKGPTGIPGAGWYDIVRRVFASSRHNNLGLTAAGIAFYSLLALFPAISALVALGGLLLLDPARIVDQLSALSGTLPPNAQDIIIAQARSVARSSHDGLGLAAVLGISIALFSASRGVGAIISGLNVAYGEKEARSFLKLTVLKVVLTIALLIGLLMALLVAAALPASLAILTFNAMPDWVLSAIALGFMALVFAGGLALFYRFGPSRTKPRWQWLSVGSVLATMVFITASAGFASFISNFSSYNESFGSIAGVVILLTWLWVANFIILLGASLNGEMEAQTRVDSTVGEPKPMGERGAVKADKLGRAFN